MKLTMFSKPKTKGKKTKQTMTKKESIDYFSQNYNDNFD